MNIFHPNPLKKWDTIWIISPSAGLCEIFPHRVENWVKMLEKMWFKVKFAKNAKKNNWYVSWTIQERVDDIHEMFLNSEVKAILCSIGWNHSNQLLKYIDFEIVRQNPKIFIGYSDISVLHYAFMSKTSLQTFYGPCLISEFWEFPEIFDYTKKYFLQAVSEIWSIHIDKINYYTDELLNWFSQEDLTRKRNTYEIPWCKRILEWLWEWQILWWCIPSINHLIGSEYWIDPENKIFFLDLPEWHEIWKWIPLADLDSYLADLDNIWLFDKINGLLISVPYGYSDDEKTDLEKLILRYVEWKKYPVWLNIPLWHTEPKFTIPLLANVKIDSKEAWFTMYR